MYSRMAGIEDIGRKIIKGADKVADIAKRVSGGVKGAAVGAQTAPAHPYIVPALIGAGVFLALQLLKRAHR
jgi:hypothetical protein